MCIAVVDGLAPNVASASTATILIYSKTYSQVHKVYHAHQFYDPPLAVYLAVAVAVPVVAAKRPSFSADHSKASCHCHGGQY